MHEFFRLDAEITQISDINNYMEKRTFTSAEYFFGSAESHNTLEIPDALKSQINEIVKHPGCDENYPVKIMPDAHPGVGSCVGSVIPLKGVVVPSFIGDDIGCGMTATKLNLSRLDLPSDLSVIRSAIEATIPMGRSNNGEKGDIGKWQHSPSFLEQDPSTWTKTDKYFMSVKETWARDFTPKLEQLVCPKKSYQSLKKLDFSDNLGTLGTGNHFIEITFDFAGNLDDSSMNNQKDELWILVHSGSRGLGSKLGHFFSDLAEKTCKSVLLDRFIDTKKYGYLSLGSDDFNNFLKAQKICLDFAKESRSIMTKIVIDILSESTGKTVEKIGEEISISHNFIEKLDIHSSSKTNTKTASKKQLSSLKDTSNKMFVTRKGAIKLKSGEKAIIPGAMGRQTYIVQGTGHSDSYCSCSHGAGRVLSRGLAKGVPVEKHINDLQGVECDKSEAVLDETPSAYKDIEKVIQVQKDYGMLKTLSILKPLICCKGIDRAHNK